MSAAVKDGPPPARTTNQVPRGAKEVICTYAASFWFSKGTVYPVILNEKGHRCVRGSDGLLDELDNVVSRFQAVPPPPA